MRDYLKHMKIPLILLGILGILSLITFLSNLTEKENYVRGNYQCPEQRVYDYADILTDLEEERLEELISRRQEEIGCDIVLVILNEPLKEYAESYQEWTGYLSEDEYVMVYADNFYDENRFGYNAPWGDGCIFVDNWDRSDSVYGYAYNWLSTSGRMEREFSTSDINRVVNGVNNRVNSNPYEAYRSYINNVSAIMSPGDYQETQLPMFNVAIIAMIVTFVYIMIHWSKNRGRKTTVSTTYVNGGRPHLKRCNDILIHTHVSKRHISTSSGGGGGGGGGGGHHVSSGGHSHGGGGGHH